MSDRPRRITVLYNADYDAEFIAQGDVSAVAASARAVRDALITAGYDAWLTGVVGPDLIEVLERLRSDRPDLLFNLCESLAGNPRNEPAAPALFDLFDIPYTGSDALGLGVALHKELAKDILRGRGVATPPYHLLTDLADLDRLAPSGDYPWFLKLAHEDASVGIEADNVARDRASLIRRAKVLLETWRQPVLVEKYIEGREINVSVLGNGAEIDVLPLHEIDFAAMPPDRPRIVSYAAKWDEAHVDYVGTKPVPMRDASPELVTRVIETAKAAWRAVGLRDFGRVDLRVDEHGQPWVIDINPNCDISPDAGMARAAAAAGLDYPRFIERLALIAWRRISARPPA